MFVRPGVVANCDAGGVISFAGDLLHSGHPISRGTRYILVAFLYSYNGRGGEDERAVAQNVDEDRTSAAADGDKGGVADSARQGGKRKLDQLNGKHHAT